jgi:hypothetical protein
MMTSSHPTSPEPLGNRLNLLAFLGGAIVTIGLVLFAIADTDHISGVLSVLIVLAVPAIATSFVATFIMIRLTLWMLERLIRRPGWRVALVLVPCLALAALLPVAGYYEALPLTRFRHLVRDPPPGSLEQLRAMHLSSWGGPSGELFRFQISEIDFQKIVDGLQLQSMPVNWPQRRREQAEIEGLTDITPRNKSDLIDALFPEDGRIRAILRDDYVRPAAPRYFQGSGPGLIRAVRDPDTGLTVLLILSVDRDDPRK